jgi:hypothetical protein
MAYGLFSHEVHVPAMDFAFLYPFGGFILFYILSMVYPSIIRLSLYRLSCNLIASGVATSCAGSLLTGIVEIAKTSSVYIKYFYLVGFAMTILGIAVIITSTTRKSQH